MKAPLRPCGSCPYRCDVPAGVWDADEYEKLPEYDNETGDQPIGVFMCHQQDGHVCAGWAHNVDEHTMSVRFAILTGTDPLIVGRMIEYCSPIPVFGHTEAALHGLTDIENPSGAAKRVIAKLERKRNR